MSKYILIVKAHILSKLREGTKILLLAKKMGINSRTICSWKKNKSGQNLSDLLDLTLTSEDRNFLSKNLTIELTTPRLLLRRFRLTDYSDAFTNWASSSKVTRYIRWDAHKSAKETLDYFQNRLRQYEDDPYNLSWVVTLKSSNEPIGEILLIDVDFGNKMCEVSYLYGEKYWRQGYATEALLSVLPYLNKIGFTTIVARVNKLNVGSMKVLTKCGFTRIEETSTMEHDLVHCVETTDLNFIIDAVPSSR